uniref:Uncharacterized protein n=1 Tax=Anopheles culicifacies TaxID=139723 RepID=A0A182LV78_9DIPT
MSIAGVEDPYENPITTQDFDHSVSIANPIESSDHYDYTGILDEWSIRNQHFSLCVTSEVAAGGWHVPASPPLAVFMSSVPTPLPLAPPAAPLQDCCARLPGSLVLLAPAPPPLPPTPPLPDELPTPAPPLPLLPLPPSIEPLDDWPAFDAASFWFLGLRIRFRLG